MPLVDEAIVVFNKRHGLCGYVVAENDSIEEICTYINSQLPDYMRPSHVTCLDSLPKTHRGKVDRTALPIPANKTSVASGHCFSQSEMLICDLYEELTQVRPHEPGVTFFDVGGHSLLLVRLISLLRARFSLDVPVRQLFLDSSVRYLGALVCGSAAAEPRGNSSWRLYPQPIVVGTPYPLSAGQQKIWTAQMLQPLLPHYNVPKAVEISGSINVCRLQESLQQVQRRHAILRARFIMMPDGKPMQVIEETVYELEYDTAESANIHSLLDELHMEPFNLDGGCLFRATLVTVADRLDTYVLALTLHHIVCDGISLELLVDEIRALYVGEALNPLVCQFMDYVSAELQQSYRCEASREHSSYWSSSLNGYAPLQLSDMKRDIASIDPLRAGSIVVNLTAAEASCVEREARRSSSTMFTLLLTTFMASLREFSGASDLVVNIIEAFRPLAALDSCVGYFVRSLPLRLLVELTLTGRELASAVTQKLLSVREHGMPDLATMTTDARIAAQVQELREALGQVAFVFQSQGTANTSTCWGSLKVDRILYDLPVNKFEVTMEWAMTADGGLVGTLSYNTELISRERAASLAELHLSSLRRIPHERKKPLAELLTNQQPRIQISLEPSGAPCETIAASLWQTEHNSQAVCLVGEDFEIIYSELQEEVYRMASSLNKLLSGKAHRYCGVMLPRGKDLVVAMLAVWQSGAVYVPLDYSMPEERIAWILSDTAAPVVLVDDSTVKIADTALRNAGLKAIAVRISSLPSFGKLKKDQTRSGSNLAYVLYTSGTTGNPKGVAISHRACLSHVTVGPVQRTDVVLHSNSLAFDPCIWEVLSCLFAGARLAIVNRHVLLDTASFKQFLKQFEVSFALLPTIFFHHIANTAPGTLAPLRYLAIGGEAVSPAALRNLFLSGDAPGEVWNWYGPTESTVVASYFRVLPQHVARERQLRKSIPIGKAFPNTFLLACVKDRLAKPGECGELLIGGPCVASGYLNLLDKTKAAFVQDRWTTAPPGSVLYRTGDLVRCLPDGNFVFLGRLDSQVKVQGYRIETMEVERVITSHHLVKEAFVLATDAPQGGKALAAFFVASGQICSAQLRTWLGEKLPSYMVPQFFIRLQQLPTGTTGSKVDQSALQAMLHERIIPTDHRIILHKSNTPVVRESSAPAAVASERQHVRDILKQLWAEQLGGADVGLDAKFFEVGGTSIGLILLHRSLQERLGRKVPMSALLEHTSIRAQVEFIMAGTAQQEVADYSSRATGSNGQDIAIVGMACRAPMATDVDQFWTKLEGGIDCITRKEGLQENLRASRTHEVAALGVLEDADLFDLSCFNMTPMLSSITDPQHRVLLELCHSALESAAIDPAKLQSVTNSGDCGIGVFAGLASNTYAAQAGLRDRHQDPSLAFEIERANIADSAPALVAFKLGLQGPAVAVQTACSSSAVSIHMACTSLRNGECLAALAGGVGISFPQEETYEYQPGMIMSSDGVCRPFDAAANGSVSGNGGGVIVLMRVNDATELGLPILALVKGSAINNDGNEKASYSSSSAPSQATVMRQALSRSGVSPLDVVFLESHGTGTPVGDLIESTAIADVYGHARGVGYDVPELVVGSVKSNIGHLGPAAAVLSTIKAVLALHKRTIPPTAHFTELHPLIAALSPRFRVNQAAEAWPSERPRIAAVNSFGQGGTNVHLILSSPNDCFEEPRSPSEGQPRWHILPISAATPWSLNANRGALLGAIDTSVSDLEALAVTLQEGRRSGLRRHAIVCSSLVSAKEQLQESGDCQGRCSGHTEIAFVLPGQGSQYVGMGQELYDVFPQYRAAFAECQYILQEDHGIDLSSLIFSQQHSADVHGHMAEILRETLYSQLSVFVTSYATVRLLESFSVTADYLLGHSLGEFTAAAVAGVLSLRDALTLVKMRGELMQSMPRGSMVALRTSYPKAAQLAREHGLEIAGHNSASQVVLSGPQESCQGLLKAVEETEGLTVTLLQTSHAYHSKMMGPAAAQLREVVKDLALHPPTVAIISAVTGKQLTAEQATSHEYWVSQMLQPVLFSKASENLAGLMLESGSHIAVVQAGPGKWQSSLLRALLPTAGQAECMSFLRKGDSESLLVAQVLARLWELGVNVRWAALHDSSRTIRRVQLPTYCYERVSCETTSLRSSFPTFSDSFDEEDDSSEGTASASAPRPIVDDSSYVTRAEFSGIREELSEMKKLMHALAAHLGVARVGFSDDDALRSACAPLVQLLEHPDLELSLTRASLNECSTIALHGTCDDSLPLSIGCLSSIFTLMILDHMESAGVVSHDTLVSSLLPVTLRNVTLGHLAAHTSGLPCVPKGIVFSMDETGVTAATATVKHLLDAYDSSEFVHAPGQACTYSVFGSAILGHALAAASLLASKREVDLAKTPAAYQELLTEIVVEPLQLCNTGLVSVPGSRWAAVPHRSAFLQTGAKCPPWVCGPAFVTADGVYSSPRDLSEILRRLLCVKKWPIVLRHMIQAPGGQLWFSGLCPGSAAWIALSPRKGTAVAILSNTGIDVSAELTACGERCLGLTEGATAGHVQLITPAVLQLWAEKSVDRDFLDSRERRARVADLRGPTASTLMDANIEGEILRIASKLIGKDLHQSPQATFDELGFDSLLSISFVAQLQQAFRTRLPVLPVAAVFQYPTAKALADFIREQLGTEGSIQSIATVAPPTTISGSTVREYQRPSGECLRETATGATAGQLVASSLPYVVRTPPNVDVLAIVSSDSTDAAGLLAMMPEIAPELQRLLRERGGIFFSGFQFSESEQLATLVQAFTGADSFLDYKDGISPRTAVMANKVFTSTEYPPQYDMGLHNEMSYSPQPPGLIFFLCLTAAGPACGGATPVGDSKRILQAMDPAVRRKFVAKGIEYRTNLPSAHGGHGLGLSWQKTYQTEDPEEVEAFCERVGIAYTWVDPSTGREVALRNVEHSRRNQMSLRTTRRAPATRPHPITGEEVWFNHAHLFHPSDLPAATRAAMGQIMPEEMFPKHCRFADGDDIPEADLTSIRRVLREQEIVVPWSSGDVMVLDNRRLCHGRHAFTGSRRVLVAMS